MRVNRIIWLPTIEDKLLRKHHVTRDEVKEILDSQPRIRFVERGNVAGEDVYLALGRTDAGRYLAVYFIHKLSSDALIISARDMDAKERKQYGKK
jgi:hypothetical protein